MGKSLSFALFVLLVAAVSGGFVSSRPEYPQVTVALLGDTEAGTNFGEVLQLAAAEKSDVIMINGDFGYGSSAETWGARVRSSIDPEIYPVIGSLGNHDRSTKDAYIAVFDSFRTQKNGLKTKCTGTPKVSEGHDIIIVDEVCTFNNVSIVSSGIGQVFSTPYFEKRLETKLLNVPHSNWKLAGYHYTLSSMNPGMKGNENTKSFFDIVRKYGAIGAQAHTHSVMASCPISSSFVSGGSVQCHPDFENLADRFIAPGVGIFMDSSVVKEARERGRCKNGNESGCTHMVDLITKEGYTRADGFKNTKFNPLGAMFVVFNLGGDSTKALVYYKSIDGQEIFRFTITR